MAIIRASWKRTVQVKPYESETLELAVEQDASPDLKAVDLVAGVQQLDRMLAGAGDVLIMERLNLRVAEATPSESEMRTSGAARVRKPKDRPEPAPDPKVVATVKAGDTPVEDVTDPDGDDPFLTAQ